MSPSPSWSSGLLLLTLPSVRVYAKEGSPAFAAISQLHQRLQAEPGAVVAMHQAFLRSAQTQNFGTSRVLKAPPMREWLELAAFWREGNTAPVWFLADPARTDIELIDPLSRKTQAHYVWGFPRDRFISGMRPDVVDLVRIDSPPGWFAEEGWHLTPETLNMSERLRRTEGVAYIKRRPDAALLVIGGESTRDAARVSLTLDDRPLDQWDVPAGGRFFRRVILEPGLLSGESRFSRLVASYAAPSGSPQSVRLTQFAVGSPNGRVFRPSRRLERDRIQQRTSAPMAMDHRPRADVRQFRRARSDADGRRGIAAPLLRFAASRDRSRRNPDIDDRRAFRRFRVDRKDPGVGSRCRRRDDHD